MELTPRVKQILRIVLEKDMPVSEQEIADRIGVSKRTIQREIEYIEAGVLEYSLELKKKKNAGVSIEGDALDLDTLKDLVKQEEKNEITDKVIRRKCLICELLKDRVPKKLFYYSDLFGVSEATISKDLDEINPWMKESHLEIVRKPGFGIALKGSEKSYRRIRYSVINSNKNITFLFGKH